MIYLGEEILSGPFDQFIIIMLDIAPTLNKENKVINNSENM
jgi:hypothetical protein